MTVNAEANSTAPSVAPYSEVRRKIEHIAPLGFAFTLTIWPKWLVFTLAIIAALYGIFSVKLTKNPSVREAELARGYSVGKAAYGVMVLILLCLFHRHMEIVAGAWATLALGDGMASIFGRRFGDGKLPWNNVKSWAGFGAFVGIGSLACFGLLLYTQATGNATPPGEITISPAFAAFSTARLAAAAFGAVLLAAVAESWPQRIDDNILVPAVSGLALAVFFDVPMPPF
ncbi:MAG: hypothetical protein H6684_08840 [Deltaproteobacteria bacterium]|nr:hypothetical protein [bacterium]MCB9476639.1 hypothetical protein [Deltaproteobacteria bacterium]MCB9488822.1 hypothetical protein [Deltaproteobacteria bacterium]